MSKNQVADRIDKIVKSDAEWRPQLTRPQCRVTNEDGTERAGASPLKPGDP
jgi:hypothetical protein